MPITEHFANLLCRLPLTLALLFMGPNAASQTATLTPGKVIASVVVDSNPQQSYALYLPSTFTLARKWPIIYVFDPLARGKVAVETIREAAEKFGYIVAASNNSRNGPMGNSAQAADAMWADTQRKLPIDENRRYVSGMSGGARVATAIALTCNCVAGVIANAAGFQPQAVLPRGMKFAYFAAVGDADFNYPEFFTLRKRLADAGARYRISTFQGLHDWAPPPLWQEALNWMDLQAMASGTMPRDAARIQRSLQEEMKAADDLQTKGDFLSAFRRYQSIVRDFEALAETAPARARLSELGNDKRLKDQEREEQDDVSRQQQLTGDASAKIQAIDAEGIEAVDLVRLKGVLLDLKQQIAASANPEDHKTLVLRRASAQLFAECFEAGQASQERKNYSAALIYFDLAAIGSRHPEWMHYQRALIYAAMSNGKAVVAELKLAIAAGLRDPSVLDADEFQPYHSQPQFQALREELAGRAQPEHTPDSQR